MSPLHLVFESRCDRLRSERPALLTENDLKRQVQQQVAELPLQVFFASASDGVRHLMALLQEVGDQALRRLLAIPGAMLPEEADQLKGAIEHSRSEVVGGWCLFFAAHCRIAARPLGNAP